MRWILRLEEAWSSLFPRQNVTDRATKYQKAATTKGKHSQCGLVVVRIGRSSHVDASDGKSQCYGGS